MKILYLHQGFSFIGGGEYFANDVGNALNIPVHSIVNTKNNKFNFIDISPKLPFLSRQMKHIRTMDYFTVSSLDTSDIGSYDLILSSGLMKSLITPENVPHVNIVFSTPRTLYDLYHWRRKRMKIGGNIAIILSEACRVFDNVTNNRVDEFISISPIIQRRLWKYMKRMSSVIYPPIDVSKYQNKDSEGYFLFLSRLEEEKRPEEAIQACIDTHQKLIVAGTGTLSQKLQSKYRKNKNIVFAGYVSEENKIELLAHCRALIFPAISEDYGIVPVEALASGKPVITSNDGFPPLLIQDKYGIITDGSSKGITDAIHKFDEINFNPLNMRNRALQFDYSIFRKKINEQMGLYYKDFNSRFK